MSEIFISYARSTEDQARRLGEALRTLGYGVWRDDELPPHRAYAEVIEERLRSAKAVLVVWSADAVASQWVRAEADVARQAGTLVQISVDGAMPPLPFNQIQCVDMSRWSGDPAAPGWRRVTEAMADLVGAPVAPTQARPASPPPPRPSKPSVAVLPFANLSGDPDQEYFADGMVDEIATALSRFRSLFVVASGSSLTLKHSGVGPQEAARALGVRYLLDGSVRKAGERVRIAVKLIDGDDGGQIWAERFEDTLDDLFALQDRLALSVAGAIEPAVRESEIRRAVRRPTESQDSHDLYLRALPLYRSMSAADNVEALDLLTRAIKLDPNHGAAVSLAASCHSRDYTFEWTPDPEASRRQGVELAHQALKLAGDDPDVLVRAASVLSQDSTEDVARYFDRAIALNPASAGAHVIIAHYHLTFGDPAQAQSHLETSMRLDPLSPIRATQVGMLGSSLFAQGQFEAAIPLLQESLHLLDREFINRYMLAACYGHLGRPEDGRAELKILQGRAAITVAQFAERMFRRPEVRKLFLDGVARLEAGG